ncbi:ABC transporter ATP-binding protein [Streptomyces lomondensis]|uniref:ABC transporter ATP-binding protein n=1 Tax=Streptomyces lomondensis TaxID=68229 RepID=A0ABQ2WYE1_9ACTN|nr:ABC transporter ATP-binding protein [Streptomyces lomondensis]MCF0079097.1 ABC transporter ATP-binding protein [Streptomyces lomondensis]GGW80199.1 ABC transporter ATP-binding protein [Streptomyces lomondensis]
MAGDWAVELHGVRKRYGRGRTAVHALRGIDLTLHHGSYTAVMGPSGSGKSTFLQCAAGLDRPTAGAVRLGGTEITGMKENKLTALRRTRVGFVFQAFNLLPSLTVEQNVVLPMRLAGHRPDRRRAAEVLAQVGLADKARRRPGQLSGGQQQRVAIARALVTRPDVVFADEPTGALDTTTATEILTLLRQAVDTQGATVVMVTHDPAAAAWADRVLFLTDGEIIDHLDRDAIDGPRLAPGHPDHLRPDRLAAGRERGAPPYRAHADRIAARMTSLAGPRARTEAAA